LSLVVCIHDDLHTAHQHCRMLTHCCQGGLAYTKRLLHQTHGDLHLSHLAHGCVLHLQGHYQTGCMKEQQRGCKRVRLTQPTRSARGENATCAWVVLCVCSTTSNSNSTSDSRIVCNESTGCHKVSGTSSWATWAMLGFCVGRRYSVRTHRR
jgi:hypothetical protein